jgi:cobyrinic acid a,c-diamide synthase
MGLFDGSEGTSERGSTAEMAKLLALPVVLVVDVAAMARSAAALIQGYTSFDPDLRVAGVILNNLGSRAHADMIRAAVAGAVPILGALPRDSDLVVPERHLGLHLPHEAHAGWVDALADLIDQHVDLDGLLASALVERRSPTAPPPPAEPRVRIAVARDDAFCFYYQDNLDLLEDAGAELVPFSPLADPLPTNIDGVYIGGGYPELHAAQLAANTNTREAIRTHAAAGGPIYAECGGLMYLAQTLTVDGTEYPGCRVLPFGTTIPAPLALAYVEVTTLGGLFGTGHTTRGHLFHHSTLTSEPPTERHYRLTTSRGETTDEGYAVRNVLASYAHLHFASNPTLAAAFVDACARATRPAEPTFAEG